MKGWFLAMDHQHKGEKYVHALVTHGWKETANFTKAAFILLDADVLGRRPIAAKAHKQGKKIFLYPHAARPTLIWDGPFEPYQYISANFVIAKGHAEVMRRYGYPHPMEVTGWTYCNQQPFQATAGRRLPGRQTGVLFGPNHPNVNGWLSDVDMDINRRAYAVLLALVRAGQINLTVQHLQELDHNGLWLEPDVHYIRSRPNQSVDSIDAADVVVSTQTLAYLAIARGVPTIMMGESTPPRAGNSEETFRFVSSWDKYRDLMMFPLDILETDDPAGLIQLASQSDEAIQAWREMFIGEMMNPAKFVQTVDRYMET
jgi:hypothetical protein